MALFAIEHQIADHLAQVDRDDAEAERIDEIFDSLLTDPAAIAEADGWNDGEQNGEHYSDVERALADLDGVDPAALPGSDVLARLYRLAKVHGEARRKRLREIAADRYQSELNDASEARAESRAAA